VHFILDHPATKKLAALEVDLLKEDMMKPKSRPASKARWLAYATASAASALAGNHAAEAGIHYSGIVNLYFPPDSNTDMILQLDKSGDSLRFFHETDFHHVPGYFWAGVGMAGRKSHGVAVVTSSFDEHTASRLHRGQAVSRAPIFGTGSALFTMVAGDIFGYFTRGTGYVGFFFNNGAGRQYGWARVRMLGARHKDAYYIVDYAYADPGEQIRTGQKDAREPDAPVEESLGCLALGAAGLAAWRKRRGLVQNA
jgi:hypothetical protein